MKHRIVSTMMIVGSLGLPVVAGAKGGPPASHPQPSSHKCKAHRVAYIASGTLAAAATLTQTKGSDTPADMSDDRYSGTLSVTVTRANHHATGATTPQSYAVSDIRLGEGLTASVPAGTRVKLIGKITKVSKKCSDHSGAGVVTIRKAVLRAAPTA